MKGKIPVSLFALPFFLIAREFNIRALEVHRPANADTCLYGADVLPGDSPIGPAPS